jgi:hypothetical protein
VRTTIALALISFALLVPRAARADPAAVLADHLEHVLADAADDLAACGTQVGLPAPAPAIAIRLRFAGGRIKLELQGLEQLPKPKRKPLEKCLGAAIVRHTAAKADLAFRPLALKTLAPPVPPYDPALARACTTSADCIIVCQDPGNCCAGQCGCKHAVNSSQLESMHAAWALACSKPTKCPEVGCALEQFHAECEKGACIARRGDGF